MAVEEDLRQRALPPLDLELGFCASPVSPALQADSLPSELPGKPFIIIIHC